MKFNFYSPQSTNISTSRTESPQILAQWIRRQLDTSNYSQIRRTNYRPNPFRPQKWEACLLSRSPSFLRSRRWFAATRPRWNVESVANEPVRQRTGTVTRPRKVEWKRRAVKSRSGSATKIKGLGRLPKGNDHPAAVGMVNNWTVVSFTEFILLQMKINRLKLKLRLFFF